MENPLKVDDLGVPICQETSRLSSRNQTEDFGLRFLETRIFAVHDTDFACCFFNVFSVFLTDISFGRESKEGLTKLGKTMKKYHEQIYRNLLTFIKERFA